ncbi:hypothetical protein CEXT_649441 [Caerostris extrusa]|uniref:Uncharacterized protein n=1 Tax=Caerostris extrusa TaxID=172846 RepID=A0AAV4RNT8_CAEEX|nr:hypothetical protein CEXT_649441 [Caerostris extrusa]
MRMADFPFPHDLTSINGPLPAYSSRNPITKFKPLLAFPRNQNQKGVERRRPQRQQAAEERTDTDSIKPALWVEYLKH